jgi:hypothetical protein
MYSILRGAGVVLLVLLAAGCGGGLPSGDEGKSEQEIREKASSSDVATLEQIVNEYVKARDELGERMTKLLLEKGASAEDELEKEGETMDMLMRNLMIYESELYKKKSGE